ncbi:PmoA family protein [Draconibacterium sp.]|nr:PmoA family protein [Draconibacterium sp.]
MSYTLITSIKNISNILALLFLVCACNPTLIEIDDSQGVPGQTNAPISVQVQLNSKQITAAKEGRLGLVDLSVGNSNENIIPVQLEKATDETEQKIVFNFPAGAPGLRKFKIVESNSPFTVIMNASIDTKSAQHIITEGNKKVLQYNYQTVYEKDVLRPKSKKDVEMDFSNVEGIYYDEYLKAHPELEKNNTTTSSIYAIPRSDYIHPLYGLDGEMLTRDWPDGGHPHHRGIFWAWPEVEYGTKRGDLYALQAVFARPTGNVEFTSGPVYAEINAENLWVWDEKVEIVRENAIIRVYHSISDKRIIDLTIKLLALKDSVTIATRFTNSYGGLNIRMQTPELQDISYFTDNERTTPLRAWSDFNGTFEGNQSKSGLMVLQHQENPEYPGAWRDYPDLAWVQPTFPTPDTRYKLSTEEQLVLRFRLINHSGGKPDKNTAEKNWDAYHNDATPR